MKPKKQIKLNFKNKCNCKVNYSLLEKAMLWYNNGTLFSDRVIYMHGRYPAVSIYNEKIHIHRLIGMFLNKKKISRQIVVHHKNGNRLDCDISNLELMSCSIHASHHNKGKKLSKEHREKISENNKKRKGVPHRKIYPMSDLKELLLKGLTVNKISKIYGCDWSTVKDRINSNPELLEDK